jgi:hypothetical protein
MNSRCEIVPFHVEHLDRFEGKVGGEWLSPDVDLKQVLAIYAKQGTLFSVIVGDKVVAVGGLLPLWKGVGEVFANFSPEGEHYMKSIHRAAKGIIAAALADGFWRIQTNILAGFEKGILWVEGLGFVQEGPPMRKYSPSGKDMLRYVIVKEG